MMGSISKYAHLGLLLLAISALRVSAQVDKVKRSPEVSPSPSGQNVVLDSRGGARTIDLGGGRGRLRVPFEPLQPVTMDEKGRIQVDRPSFLVDWLRQDLPQRFPGIERVEMLETILSRDTGVDLVSSSRRDLEIYGDKKALATAEKWIHELLSLRETRIIVDCHLLTRKSSPGDPHEIKVECLTQESLDILLPTFQGSLRHLSYLLWNGRRDRKRDLKPRKFLRQVKVEHLESGDIVVPEIKTAYEGLQGSVAALLLPGAREIVVNCDFGLGVLIQPVMRKKVTLLGRDYLIESPEIVSLRWASDRIVLGPEEAGFRVSGIVLPFANEPESTPELTVDILVQVQVQASDERFVLGKVMGFDQGQGIVFSQIKPQVNIQPGSRLSVIRKGRVVGRVETLEVTGGMTTLRLLKGKAARGDELR